MTITLTREEAQQVLDALENPYASRDNIDDAAETLRARLAQPEPEPVAWQDKANPQQMVAAEEWDNIDPMWHWMYQPLYTAPPQREWQKITDHEADEYWDESVSTGCRLSFGMGVDYANRVLREKNR